MVCPLLSSRPEESHPRALPDPCVNLSIHTAPDVQPLAHAASSFTSSTGSSCCQLASVGPWPRLNNAAPSLQPHYRTFITTTGCSAPVLRIGTTGSHVPYKSQVGLRAAYMPDTARAGFRVLPN